MTTSPTLADLRVKTRNENRESFNIRLATREDILAVLGGEVLPLRKSALFGWVLVFGQERQRPTHDAYLIVPVEES